MNINVINNAAATVPPVIRTDKVSSDIPVQTVRYDQVKLSEESRLLDASKSDPSKNVNPEYSNNAPVAGSKDTLKTLLETVQREIPTNDKSSEKVRKSITGEKSDSENKPEIKRKELGRGFFVTLPDEEKTEDNSGNPRLEAFAQPVSRYYLNQRMDTGRLIDMFL